MNLIFLNFTRPFTPEPNPLTPFLPRQGQASREGGRLRSPTRGGAGGEVS